MKLKILLINPWIYDFAAFNLWSRPLGLLKVAEHLSAYGADLSMVDCTDSFKPGKYGCGKFRVEPVAKPEILKTIPRTYKRYGISTDEFVKRIKTSRPFDAILITSLMSYWYPGVQKAVEITKDILGDLPVILGGIYATLYHEHAAAYSGADLIYRGSDCKGLSFALQTFGFRPKKKRAPIPFYRLGLYENWPFAPLLTASGCPFSCTYCASGLLTDKYKRRPYEDVFNEIKGLSDIGVRDYSFYDDALLVNADEHIKPLLRNILKHGMDVRLHTPNGLHARFIDDELAGLMQASGFKTIRLSLETVDARRQATSDNKVNNADIENAIRHLKKHGFTKEKIGIYLMYGLPGQDLEEVKDGVQFLKALGVRINLTEFSPIKGTKAWEKLAAAGIISDSLDPLLTNNTVFSYLYSNYDREEVKTLKLEVKKYNEMTF